MSERRLTQIPPEALFIVSGISMYAGAAIAVTAFEYLDAPGVAWWRVMFAGAVLTLARRSWRGPWTRRQLLLAAAFGSVLAAMNLNFYFAIDRLPLGTTVAIEFAGPVAVAAIGTRTRRSLLALVFTASGVLVLADVSFDISPAGVWFALAAAVLWAGYIVLGARVAAGARSLDGLGLGMVAGALVIAPIGLPPALRWGDAPWVLLLALATALLSNVIPYSLDQMILRRIPRARFALLLALLPASATVMGLVALRQVPGGLEVLGIALVVLGIALAERSRPAPVPTGVD